MAADSVEKAEPLPIVPLDYKGPSAGCTAVVALVSPLNQSASQSPNQPIKQSINPSSNQSIMQSMYMCLVRIRSQPGEDTSRISSETGEVPSLA